MILLVTGSYSKKIVHARDKEKRLLCREKVDVLYTFEGDSKKVTCKKCLSMLKNQETCFEKLIVENEKNNRKMRSVLIDLMDSYKDADGIPNCYKHLGEKYVENPITKKILEEWKGKAI